MKSGRTTSTRSGAPRAYGGVSAEQRREQRRTALLDAAFDIIGTRGSAKLTIAGLCAEAGLNERYFRESFPDLDSVLIAVFDRVIDEIAATALRSVAATGDGDARVTSRVTIGAIIDVLTEDPRKGRIFVTETHGNAVLSARRAEAIRMFIGIVYAAGSEFYGPALTLRVGEHAQFTAAFLIGGLFEAVSGWLHGTLDISQDELVDYATEAFVQLGETLAAG